MKNENLKPQSEEESEYITEAEYWRNCLELANKAMKKNFITPAETLTRAYAAKRAIETTNLTDSKQPYHIFYANVSTMQPAVYAKPPKIVVQRRFKDKDPIARVAAQVLERATQAQVDLEDFDPAVRSLRDDWLIRGRGLSREVFSPIIAQKSDQQGQYDDVIAADIKTEYIHWRDFVHPNCRSWNEVGKRWIAFKIFMGKDELMQRFGDKAQHVQLDAMQKDAEKSEELTDKESYKQATIWEIWDAKKKRVMWLPKSSSGANDFLDVQDDPLRLRGFFPCPRPIYATLDNDSLYPTADFVFYSDLAQQLNLIQWKIDSLIKALKVVGCRDASAKELDRLLAEDCEFELIPVENFPIFSEKGGLEGAIHWMPLKQVVEALQFLYGAQDQCLAQIQQTSGMADILRGYGDPRSTATAERIKAQFAAPRLDERKREMQRYLRDVIRIKAEIIAEHFTDQHLALASDIEQLSEQERQMFPMAVQLLRDDKLRTFRIDIETDSTALEDNEALKQQRIEVMTHVGTFLKDVSPMIGAQPALLPLAKEMLMFTMRTFNESRGLEAAVEQVFDQLQAQPPPQQPPDPKIIEMQQRAQLEQAKMQFETQKFQVEAQQKQAEQMLRREEMQTKAQLESAKYQTELEKLKTEYELKMREIAASMDKSEKDRQAQIYMQTLQAQAPANESSASSGGASTPVIHINTGSKKKMVSLSDQVDPLTGAVRKVGMVEELDD